MSLDASLQRSDIRNAVVCAIATTAAFFAVNPFVQMAFNDDFMYAFTVRELLRTGHVTYHCGEQAAFITQAYWGAFFVRMFGFSFVALRFSTLPWAAGCAALCYLLARSANLLPTRAIFLTVLLGFSPLFLPLATSFMSDVPALFAILMSLYAFVLAARAASIRIVLAALAVGFTAGLFGGLSRQIVWIVPLTSGLHVAWLRRRQPSVLIASIVGLLANSLAALMLVKWFFAQPYVIAEWGLNYNLRAALREWRHSQAMWLGILLTTVLLILPAAIPATWLSLKGIWRDRAGRRGAIAAGAALIVAIEISLWPDLTVEPWLGHVVSNRGALWGMELSGRRPISQPLFLREFLASVVIFITWLMLTEFADRLLRPHPIRRLSAFFQPPDNNIALPAMFLFATVYLAIFAYHAPRGYLYDRYSLPLIPCISIPLLLKSQGPIGRARILSAVAWVVLAIWSLYAIAATQDVHALAAARRQAIDRLYSAGVHDTAIACGLEYDDWTQLVHEGHMNIIGINSPPGSYNPAVGETPSLKCLYRVEFAHAPDTIPSAFGSVNYLSWLPPFHRRIYIDRFRNPAWLDPATNIPPPMDYEDFHFD
jgi:hypothetical protein